MIPSARSIPQPLLNPSRSIVNVPTHPRLEHTRSGRGGRTKVPELTPQGHGTPRGTLLPLPVCAIGCPGVAKNLQDGAVVPSGTTELGTTIELDACAMLVVAAYGQALGDLSLGGHPARGPFERRGEVFGTTPSIGHEERAFEQRFRIRIRVALALALALALG